MISNPALSAVTPIKSRGLSESVYTALLDLLIYGELRPDSPLAIDRIAQSMNVSPTPVREALARLEATGMVSRVANRGYRVAPPMSANQMHELIDARLVLELGAIERAMSSLDTLEPELEKALEEHIEAARQFTVKSQVRDSESTHRYYDADWQFHQVILDHCGNRYLNRSVNSLSFSIHRMRQTVGLGTSDAPEAVREHQAILDAVRTGDAQLAVEKMREHLLAVSQRASG